MYPGVSKFPGDVNEFPLWPLVVLEYAQYLSLRYARVYYLYPSSLRHVSFLVEEIDVSALQGVEGIQVVPVANEDVRAKYWKINPGGHSRK